MATARPKLKQIRLTYDFSNRKVDPASVPIKKGETIEFVSDQGLLHVLLEPADAYHPSEFRTGDPPVVVKELKQGMFWCGGTFRVAEPGTAGTSMITINPEDKQYGSTPILDPDPGGTGQ